MIKLHKIGLRMLIVFALYFLSTENALSKVGTSGRDGSGKNSIPSRTTAEAPQVCGGINFTSQAQVDAFPATYDCSDIIGNISISGADITNVDSLASLRSHKATCIASRPMKLIVWYGEP